MYVPLTHEVMQGVMRPQPLLAMIDNERQSVMDTYVDNQKDLHVAKRRKVEPPYPVCECIGVQTS